MSVLDPAGTDTVLLARQGGAVVFVVDGEVVFKKGSRVKYREEAAMRTVAELTTVPVPHVYFSTYLESYGSIAMSMIPGTRLDHLWDEYDEGTKTSICNQIWNFVAQLRQIPKPDEFHNRYQCSADGSTTRDVLIKDLHEPPSPIFSEQCLRKRICERYEHYGGQRFSGKLFDMLPSSKASVFTHGDLTPRNILVDKHGIITGIVDWENSGWYPDYWEYCNMVKPSNDKNWMEWMERTAPHKMDLSGIVAARRILF